MVGTEQWLVRANGRMMMMTTLDNFAQHQRDDFHNVDNGCRQVTAVIGGRVGIDRFFLSFVVLDISTVS